MSLMQKFEAENKEVYEVTQNEWLTIMQDHLVNTCGRSIELFNATDKIEIECFHKSQVEQALKKGIIVSELVLKDYVGLVEKVQAKQTKIESIPILTKEICDSLQVGNKITVDGCKLTVYRKDENSIIARIYRKQKQAYELIIGERYNLVMGWS